MDPIALSAEALVAVSGLLREKPLTAAEAEEARKLPATWAEEVTAFLSEDKWRKFTLPKHPDYLETRNDLIQGLTPEDNATLIEQIQDSELAQAYIAKLGEVRQYLMERWTVNQVDTATGPVILTPSTMQQGQAWALFDVLNTPGRILDEMLMGTLLEEQAKAFKDCYPELFDRLRGLIDAEVKDRQAKGGKKSPYTMPWERERVLRRLLGLTQEVPIVSKTEPPPAQPAPGAEINIDFARERSRLVETAT